MRQHRIREAVDGDVEAMTAIYAHEVLHGTATFELAAPSAETMSGRMVTIRDQGLPWIVAEIDGEVAGYAYLAAYRVRPAYRYTVENSIYVAPTARGRGVGRVLLEALLQRARDLGLRHVVGVISESETSIASIALHRTYGFAAVGVHHQVGWKFDRWLDVTLMQLDLCPDGAPPTGPGLTLGASPG